MTDLKMEFWNSQLTEKSWELLKEFNKEYDFILIGGWATYLLTKQQKSKDIDVVVSIEELQKLKLENLSKNDRLKRYEIKKEEIDIDIYVEYYSKLTLPLETLKKHVKKIEGFKVVSSESLLVLKQGAYNDRKGSIKGEKDLIDMFSVLVFSDIDFKKYFSLLKENSLENYIKDLIIIVRNFKDYNSLNLTPRELKSRKNKILKILREI